MKRGIALTLVFGFVIFSLSGFPSFIAMILGATTIAPKLVALTPIACFLYLLMLMGIAMIIRLDPEKPQLYSKQFLVGFAFIIFPCLFLTVLHNFGVT